MITPIVKECGDYEVVIVEAESHHLSFNVYSVLGKTETGQAVYNRDGYESSPDPVESRELAQVFLSGSVKWDGCSNLNLEDQPLHFCGREDAEELGALLSFIYDLGKEMIPSWEGDD